MSSIQIISILLVLFLLISFWYTGYKKIKIVDQKIAEFKNKNFPSPEEREKAKEQLKNELLEIRNKVFWFYGGSKYFIFLIDGRIMNL